MDNRFEHIDDLIALVVAGEATEPQRQLVNEWISLSDENAKSFQSSMQIYKSSEAIHSGASFDSDKAWMQVKKKIAASGAPDKVISIKPRSSYAAFFRIAAMLALVSGLAAAVYFMLNSPGSSRKSTLASGNRVQYISLPDGSKIYLNKNSSITYDEEYFQKERSVELTGEAFFEVKHEEQNPFTVLAGGLTITDIGTSFNVRTLPDSGKVDVAVATGEVKLTGTHHDEIHVTQGESAGYNAVTGEMKKWHEEDRNLSAYKDKDFIFDNTELRAIVKMLNEIYSKNIVLGDTSIGNCHLTATFNNEPLDSILSVIAETLQLQVDKTASEIRLNGNGCK